MTGHCSCGHRPRENASTKAEVGFLRTRTRTPSSLSLSLSVCVSFSSVDHASRQSVSLARMMRRGGGGLTGSKCCWKWFALSCKRSVGDELQFRLPMTNRLERMSVENGGHTRKAKHQYATAGQCTLTVQNRSVYSNRGIEKEIGG